MLLQGDPGTSIEMGVLRVGRSEAQKMSVVRAAVAFPPVESHMNGQVGIIQLETLQPGSVQQVATAIASLEKQGAKKN